MNWFFIFTVLFTVVSIVMILIILVQRPSGGGLAGAFGGAGGGGTDTVFGGRVGDALTWATVIAFVLYLAFAIGLNLTPIQPTAAAAEDEQLEAPIESPADTIPVPPLEEDTELDEAAAEGAEGLVIPPAEMESDPPPAGGAPEEETGDGGSGEGQP